MVGKRTNLVKHTDYTGFGNKADVCAVNAASYTSDNHKSISLIVVYFYTDNNVYLKCFTFVIKSFKFKFIRWVCIVTSEPPAVDS